MSKSQCACGQPVLKGRARCRKCFNDHRRGLYGSDAPLGARNTGKPDQVVSRWPSVDAFDNDGVAKGLDLMAAEMSRRVLDTLTSTEKIPYDATTPMLPVPPTRAPKIEVIEETITRVEEHRLKRQVKDLKAENAELIAQLSDGGEFHEIISEVIARQGEVKSTIEPRERRSGLLEATPLILASDWHVEHEVRPEQVAGRNRYNLEIAKRRMERYFEATRWAIRHQREVFKVRDLIFWIGGDIIQNYLHEDDNESNLLSPTEALLFAQAEITAGIRFLLEDPELEQILIPTNDGNHGRLTKKMRSSTRIENSLEVFLYAQLALTFRDESRVKITLPTSQFTFLDVYGRTIRFLHGDVFKYGGGVGGITVPMLRALARWESVKKADLTCMGHWHQRINLPNVMVNGSLIGYDPYAMGGGFPFEPPVQSLRMLEPKRWCSTDIPLWVADREDDDMSVYPEAA